MSSAIFAQSQKPQSFKFDVFKELSESDWKQKLDRVTEIQKGYRDSYIGIIVYAQIGNDRKTLNSIKENYKTYLTKTKKTEKFFIESGGLRKNFEVELWIIPKSAEYPKATPDEYFKPEKVAEFGKVSDEQLNKFIEDFLINLRNEQTATGYIITYGNQTEIEIMEKFILDSKAFSRLSYDPLRIVFVNGGGSENLKTILWFVPQGAEPPTP